MFIKTKFSGYNRHGEQVSAGLFLILMQPKTDSTKYPMLSTTCADCGRIREDHKPVTIPGCSKHGIIARIRAAKSEQEREASINEMPPVVDCEECAAYHAAKREAGCTYFRPEIIDYPIRAIVRHTSFRQLGHFMMGCARVHGERITLSGSYGGDGLPCNVPDVVYESGMELPADLRAAWSTGGGWNSAGSEAPQMRAWALQHLAALRQ